MSKNALIYRVPMLSKGHVCPLCKNVVRRKYIYPVRLYSRTGTETLDTTLLLYICDRCDVAYSDRHTNQMVKRTESGFHLIGLTPKKSATAQEIRELMGKPFSPTLHSPGSSEVKPVLYSVPTFGPSCVCPVCRKTARRQTLCNVVLYRKDSEVAKESKCVLYYCDKCNVFYTNRQNSNLVKNENPGFRIREFPVEKTDTPAMIRNKMLHRQDAPTEPWMENPKPSSRLLKTSSINPAGIRKKISFLSPSVRACASCSGQLWKYTNSIPCGEKLYAQIPGWICDKCNIFYAPEEYHSEVVELLKNPATNDYTLIPSLSESASFPVYQKAFREEPRHLVFLMLQDCCSGIYIPLIISSKIRQKYDPTNVTPYTAKKARRLLTEIAYFRKTTFDWAGRKFTVAYSETRQGSSLSRLPLLTKTIEIKPGGGFADARNPDVEVVSVLLYSPYTKTLELSQASYDKKKHRYYMDISFYNQFVWRYGNPGISVYYKTNYVSSGDLSGMRAESLLYVFGYNVNQVSELSAQERWAILGYVMDLELLTPKEVAKRLETNIALHQYQGHDIACEKWSEDLAFTMSYRVNPERFIIGQVRPPLENPGAYPLIKRR